jgi:Kef-type K+ transport system membrane component KefB
LEAILDDQWHFSGVIFAVGLTVGIRRMKERERAAAVAQDRIVLIPLTVATVGSWIVGAAFQTYWLFLVTAVLTTLMAVVIAVTSRSRRRPR